MKNNFENCTLCPRNCGADRTKGAGFCGERDVLRISRAALHFWEEPCISGTRGSGTVFFCGCQLKCSFCQNHDIANSIGGGEISPERLAEIFFELCDKGAHNINLVTPSHFTPLIIEAVDMAKSRGFALPFVWNCGGYEKPETLETLRGYVDVFMPDFKYMSAETAARYSAAKDYPEVAMSAVSKMFELVGKTNYDSDGMMTRGVLVRHLVLPTHADESIDILKYLYDNFGNDIAYGIMNQYTPMPFEKHPELSRKLTTYEYQKVLAAAEKIGITNGFVQEGETCKESFIPPFDMTGVYSP